MEWVFALLFALVFLWYLTFTASRLDRLHHRVETSWASLDALLQRRAAIALEIAFIPSLDPAAAVVLTRSAYLAREAEMAERSEAEESLTNAIALIGESEDFHKEYPEISERLEVVTSKIRIAIDLHREAVATTKLQRSRPVVRFFRLAGRAPLPVVHPFEEVPL
ncbi:MAG: LemA family protein [Actinobacteria bacterium]|nr:LemA family protein [Actinomycetota bacterium]